MTAPCCQRAASLAQQALRHEFCNQTHHDICAGFPMYVQIQMVHYRLHQMAHMALR